MKKLSKTDQVRLCVGLAVIAATAKKGGLSYHEAVKAIREAAIKEGLPATNKDIRDAVRGIYKGIL